MKAYGIGAGVSALIIAATVSVSAEDLTIGYANQGVAFVFNAAIAKGVQAEAERLGVHLVELDAAGDLAKQSNDIQDLIAQQVDGVLIGAVDSTAAMGFVDKVAEAGIPIVAVATQVGDPSTRAQDDVYENLVALVTQNEVAAGETAGRLAGKLVPGGGKIAIIEGITGTAQVELRARNFVPAAAEEGAAFEVVTRQPANWNQEKAFGVCQNILQANTGLTLIYAQNDPMAIGCAKAAKAAGIEVAVIGIGGSKFGLAAVAADDIQGTVCYQPETMGALGLRTLVNHVNGTQELSEAFINYDTPGIDASNLGDCDPQW
ncbi:MAG: sugar ABC transporter substrate-binding protein [Paracoccaceae bacterium]|nr:sugar ABC transporter substrate-binding protein [Paracoccaceae bacterium]